MMTNSMDMIPPTCCPAGGESDLIPLLIVVGVWFALHLAFQWIRKRPGKPGMNILKKTVILATVVGAVVAVVVLKQNHDQTGEQAKPAGTSAPIASPAEVAPATLPRLVDLGADKCIPCKMMAPILEDLKTTYTNQMQVDFIDVWKNPDAGEPYGIRTIPTQIFFDASGKELFRHEGFFPKEDILVKWKELGYAFK